VSPSVFVAVRRVISSSLLRPVLATIIPTLMDLINDLAYLVSLGSSSIGAFSNPFI
jgi:hypothetical protein